MEAGSALPVNAYLLRDAESLTGDRTRGWYFSVLVRASMARLAHWNG